MRIAAAPALLAALVFLSSGRAAPAADPLPTAAEIHQLFDEAKYPQVLQKLQRVLILKGAAAKPYDRHDLLRLRGETQLHLKSVVPAAQSFTEAADATEDAAAIAVDRATALLIKRSPQLAYAPKNNGKGKPAGAAAAAAAAEPIPIVDPASRKKALGALFDDELAATQPKLKAVAEAKQLSVILDAVPMIRDLRSLELAATEKDERTKKVLGDLATRARDLLAKAVTDEGKKVDAIEKTANETIEIQDFGRDPKSNGRGTKIETQWKKRGLNRTDAGTLRDSFTLMEKVAAACHEMADALGDKSTDFAPVRADAEKVAKKADSVLNTDYTRRYTRPPGN